MIFPSLEVMIFVLDSIGGSEDVLEIRIEAEFSELLLRLIHVSSFIIFRKMK